MSIEKLSVVVGGQFGSEGKGHLTAALVAESELPVINVRVAGPNAGHTAVGVLDGQPWALRQVPAGAVASKDALLYIADGSEVDPTVLLDEVKRLDEAGYAVSGRLFISARATVLDASYKQQEADVALTERIGSTGKGIGAARAARIMRAAKTVANLGRHELGVSVISQLPWSHLTTGWHVVIEGTQGYGLGLHTRYYPQVTSSDCRAVDFLAMAGISPWGDTPAPQVWVVIRPYPIRVAGNSGPLHQETSWAELGLPEEKTTVTRKIRRVGQWDKDLVREAAQANGGSCRLALCMADQPMPFLRGLNGNWLNVDFTAEQRDELLRGVEMVEMDAGPGSRVNWLGTGPDTHLWMR